ncbi:MAG: hypothetical protein WCZ89_10020 [Phycisphaerae bacterium]
MTRKLKITVLVDEAEIPADDPDFIKTDETTVTEYHVIRTLRQLRYNVSVVPAGEDIKSLVNILTENRPQLVFNLTEHIGGERWQDKSIAALLDVMKIPFTGTGVNGLFLTRDKQLCKRLLSSHRVHTPAFAEFSPGKPIRISKKLPFPLVVKPNLEDSSEGISNDSLVKNEDELKERVEFVMSRWNQPVIAEQFIDGRELYVGIMGNSRLKVLPVRECFFNHAVEGKGPYMATYRVKYNKKYREKWNIEFGFADLEASIRKKVENACKKTYRILQIQDYGRIDMRLTENNEVFIIEANANPDIAYGEEIAESAHQAGLTYEKFIDRIIQLALARYKG